MAKRSKEELLQNIRDHGGETPDEFTLRMLEDITDSWGDTVDNTDELNTLKESLTAAQDELSGLRTSYDTLKKSYADRFTLKQEQVQEETETKEEKEEAAAEAVDSYDSIFDD